MALKPADITLVKTIKSPPSNVKLTFAGMCVIVGIAPEKLTDPAAKKNVTIPRTEYTFIIILYLLSMYLLIYYIYLCIGGFHELR